MGSGSGSGSGSAVTALGWLVVAGVLLPGRLVAAIANELRVVAPFVLIECLWAGWCDAAGLGVWIGSVTAAAEAPGKN